MGNPNTKVCCRCYKTKPLEEFGPDKRARDSHQSACRSCVSDRAKDLHNKNIVSRKALAKKHRDRKTQKLYDYKTEKGCRFCGFKDHGSALDFHHPNPDMKEFNVGNIRRRAWSKIQKEIDKCWVVCANCHRMLHQGVTLERSKH